MIENSSTPFEKVSVIYRNYYYYDFINLTGFILIAYYWVSVIYCISNTKLRNNAEKAPSGITGASTENENDLRVKL